MSTEPKKSWVVIMTDTLYCGLPKALRYLFDYEKVIYNDYELYKDDPKFMELYKAKRDAKKAYENWTFEKRNGKH